MTVKKKKIKLERDFQPTVKDELEKRFPGCIVTKMDTSLMQGAPDLLILYKNKWATLECKREEKSAKQPNQEHYVKKMNDMSFSRIIYPENKEEVFNELQHTFEL